MDANVTLHHTALGSAGSRVMFLDGLFGQGKNWLSIAKRIAEQHQVLLVDLPHHGRSPWCVTVVGHSLGGKVAMMLALHHPERVERLAVVDISPVDYDAHLEFDGYIETMHSLDLTQVERRNDAEQLMKSGVPDPSVRSFLLQNLRRDPAATDGWSWQFNLDVLGRDLAAIGAWPADELASLPPYGGPVLWLAGGRSEYVRQAHEGAMDRWFPHVSKMTIDDAGHWLHSEQPERVVAALHEFLGD